MSLKGDLKTMALPDILQWIAVGQKTGTLQVERRSIKKRIIVRDGLIFSSWSNDPRESLGQFLIRTRKITRTQLDQLLVEQQKTGKRLGELVSRQGLVTKTDIETALREQAQEEIYDLFLWPRGAFEFKEGDFPQDVLIAFETAVTPVIMEGIRRVDEWQRIRAIFPTMETTFKVQGEPQASQDPLDRQVLGLAAAGKTMAAISLELRRSEFETAAIFFDLHARGLVAVDKVQDEAKSPDPVGAIQGLLSLAYQRLQEKRYDAAVQAYEEVLSLDRLNQHAKKGLISAMEARQREKAVRTVPLGKVPHLLMDLATLTRENFDSHEGFVLSRVNGEWDVQSILKLCPMTEEDALLIFARLLERKVIDLR